MDNTKTIEKINKLAEKKKSAKIIKFLDANEVDVIIAAMDALGTIRDEDSVNSIAHLIDHEDPKVRCAAANCLGQIGTEYCKTYLQHRAASESDATVKTAITDALHTLAANK